MKDIDQQESPSEKDNANAYTASDNSENISKEPVHKTVETVSPVDISSPALIPIETLKN